MSFLESVFKKITLSDNRKAQRLDSPMLVAYYFDGATPTAHEIQNISSDGFYLLTDDRLRPGTLVTMTIQKSSDAKESSSSRPHLTVMSIVVRQGEDGVAFAFIPNDPKGSDQEQDEGYPFRNGIDPSSIEPIRHRSAERKKRKHRGIACRRQPS